jgi:hypothetical protein
MHNRSQRAAQARFPHVHNLFKQVHSGFPNSAYAALPILSTQQPLFQQFRNLRSEELVGGA